MESFFGTQFTPRGLFKGKDLMGWDVLVYYCSC